MRKIFLLLGVSLILAGVAVAAQASSGDAPCVQETSPANVSITVAAASDSADGSNCLECHSNAELLAELGEEDDTPAPPSEGSG